MWEIEWHRCRCCRVLHPSVESGEEEEDVPAVVLLDAGEEWHHSWVLHPPV
jgi:hypothetical protein